MARTITVRPIHYRVVIEDDDTVREVTELEAPEGTVFVLRPLSLEQSMTISKLARKDDIEEVIMTTARDSVVGWEGMRDEKGADVPFKKELVAGFPFEVVTLLMDFLTTRRNQRRKENAEKNAPSGISRD